MNKYFMAEQNTFQKDVLGELQREIFGILDRPAYNIDGAVVREPQGFSYPAPVYNFDQPYPMLAQAGSEMRLILLGVFVLLALAIILRK